MLSGDDQVKPVRKARKPKGEQDGKKADRKRKLASAIVAPDPSSPGQLDAIDRAISDISVASDHGPTEHLTVAEPAVAQPVPSAEPKREPAPEPLHVEVSHPAEPPVVESPVSTAMIVHEAATVPTVAETAAAAAVPAETDPIGYQAIADACGRYTIESFDRTQSFLGRLAAARSLDQAIELQSEFARQTYDSLVAQAIKLRELHGQLAGQRLRQWERWFGGLTGQRRAS